ncbi:hypothetical protein [Ornithinimicrobium kibberense]|uniref:hypothetical protein n=1 Tax=Ornithinimicrobium kibberense TaxID=282060 RepID=UPI003607D5A4
MLHRLGHLRGPQHQHQGGGQAGVDDRLEAGVVGVHERPAAPGDAVTGLTGAAAGRRRRRLSRSTGGGRGGAGPAVPAAEAGQVDGTPQGSGGEGLLGHGGSSYDGGAGRVLAPQGMR